MRDGTRWWDHAACKGQHVLFDVDPEDFEWPNEYDSKGVQRRVRSYNAGLTGQMKRAEQAAIRICVSQCPVRKQCLEDALNFGEEYGVRGGFTARERAAMMRERKITPWSRRPEARLYKWEMSDENAEERDGYALGFIVQRLF